MLAGKPARRDPRMTPYQRRRFRLMQAADGNANHATYRGAIAIYGEARVRVAVEDIGFARLCHRPCPICRRADRRRLSGPLRHRRKPDATSDRGWTYPFDLPSPLPPRLRHRAHVMPLIVSGILHNHGGHPMRPDLAFPTRPAHQGSRRFPQSVRAHAGKAQNLRNGTCLSQARRPRCLFGRGSRSLGCARICHLHVGPTRTGSPGETSAADRIHLAQAHYALNTAVSP